MSSFKKNWRIRQDLIHVMGTCSESALKRSDSGLFGPHRVPFRWNWSWDTGPRSERNPRWKGSPTTGWCLSEARSTATSSTLWRKWFFTCMKASPNQKEVRRPAWSRFLWGVLVLWRVLLPVRGSAPCEGSSSLCRVLVLGEMTELCCCCCFKILMFQPVLLKEKAF